MARALRSMDEVIRFMARRGSAEDVRAVREARVAAGKRLPVRVRCCQSAHSASAVVAQADRHGEHGQAQIAVLHDRGRAGVQLQNT